MLGAMRLAWPPSVLWLSMAAGITNFDLGVLGLSCGGEQSFADRFALAMLLPVACGEVLF